MDLVCNLLVTHRLGGRDLQIEHIWVGHIAVVQLIVLADDGLAFISQFWSECHRESLPINSSSVQYNTSVVQDASFCTRKRQAFCTQWHACVQKNLQF